MVSMIIDLTSSPEPDPDPEPKKPPKTESNSPRNGRSSSSNEKLSSPLHNGAGANTHYTRPQFKHLVTPFKKEVPQRSKFQDQPSPHPLKLSKDVPSPKYLGDHVRTRDTHFGPHGGALPSGPGIIIIDNDDQSELSSHPEIRRDGRQGNGRSIPSSPARDMPPLKKQRMDEAVAPPTLASIFGCDRSAEEGEQPVSATVARSHSRKGMPYNQEEDALLTMLKDEQGMAFREMVEFFDGRSAESLAMRYSYKRQRHHTPNRNSRDVTPNEEESRPRAPRRRRQGGISAVDGFVSWAQVDEWRSRRTHISVEAASESPVDSGPGPDPIPATKPSTKRDRISATSLIRSLRNRELGRSHVKNLVWNGRTIPDEVRNNTIKHVSLRQKFDDASGDISCLAWSVDNRSEGKRLRFAAGSVAVSDASSMQYNRQYNLLLGDFQGGTLQELPEHHVKRPVISSNELLNPNGFESMRNTQDERLFMTVDAVHFSPCGEMLYSGGGDGTLRAYRFDNGHHARHVTSIQHDAPVTHVCVNSDGLIASASRQKDRSVRIHRFKDDIFIGSVTFNPRQRLSAVPVVPSALRWGSAYPYRNYLLAGYASASHYTDDEGLSLGDVCLWEAETGQSLEVAGIGRNVFDLAWNPTPRAASTLFAVAGTALHLGRKTRSTVQCFATSTGRLREVLEWQCPALDINDVVYCQHDENLIAAGATDGKVYIWDMRFADRNQRPLHILCHGDSLNVLDHNQDREAVDTGVRFLSWGATSSRLYSGSSDGIIKGWNPYRSVGDAYIGDFATFQAGIMSGAFSPDYCDLLIGEERGHLNLLSLDPPINEDGGPHDADDVGQRTQQPRFDIITAPGPVGDAPSVHAAAQALLKSKQIEIRPMGDFPVRQAVQGPAYTGPYLRPLTQEWIQAREDYRAAQRRLDQAYQTNVDNNPDESQKDEKQQSKKAVNATLEALERLKIREGDYNHLLPEAQALQRSFRASEPPLVNGQAQRHRHNAFTMSGRNVSDSLDSEARIPGAVIARRAATYQRNLYGLGCSRLYALGLATRCMACWAAASTANARIKQWLSLKCSARLATLRAALSARCAGCGVPVAVAVSEDHESNRTRYCHRCRFACFRCSQPARWLPDSSRVACDNCALEWEVGVLGFDLVGTPRWKANHLTAKGLQKSRSKEFLQEGESFEEIGDEEVEHYHSRWVLNTHEIMAGGKDSGIA